MEYKNLSVLFKDNPHSEDEFGGTHIVEFVNVRLTISGDYLVITEHDDQWVPIRGRVFNLNVVDSYKINKVL